MPKATRKIQKRYQEKIAAFLEKYDHFVVNIVKERRSTDLRSFVMSSL